MSGTRGGGVGLRAALGATTALTVLAGGAGADPVDHIKKITAPDGATGDSFGYDVANNGVECLVGAPEHDQGGVFAGGAAYFFGQNLGGVDNWGFALKRNEFVPGSADRFGYRIGMTASHACVGVWGDDDNGLSAGAAYVYERNLGGIGAWGLRKKLLASDGVSQDNFGWSVEMDDDVAIVGARIKNNSQGAAYIYKRNTGGADNWGQAAKLVAPDAVDFSFFGESVSIDGNYAAVGAFQDPELGDDAGAVYIFEEFPSSAPEGPGADRTSVWKFFKKLTAPDGGANDVFGWSVCIKGDYVAVGAPNHFDGVDVLGAVYLYHRNQGGAGNFGLVKKIENPDHDNVGDSFGRSVDIDGDLLVIGCPFDGPPMNSTGAVFLYARDIGGADNWGFLFRAKDPDPATSDQLGFSVEAFGDTIVAGAIGEAEGSNFVGGAHIFRVNTLCPQDLNGDGTVDTADLGILLGAFGGSGLGDLNLDGVIDTADLGALLGGYGAIGCAYAP
ncbi:MAG: hypothetical protein H6813_06975 [Phycisphaeraceae bacterium]|nr:hypothetical protein [Phycisphaeraceae bacterium]MCB9848678.1 hypothetical protein [Phycisphaeraceae bacterium]